MMRWIAIGVGFAGLAGVGGCSAGGGGDLVGVAQVAIRQVPSDGSVGCLAVTATGATSVTQSFDVQPGQSTTLNLQDLPTGTVRFTGDAYAGACSAMTSASVPTWLSKPVLATVSTTPVVVELEMQPNGQATVGVDFPDASCRDAGAPCLSGSECCSSACVDNACTASCPAGSADCGAGCIDVSSDPNNCGACGNACPSGSCSGGTCACPSGTLSCAGGCSDVSSDPNNCGVCGNVCPAGEACSDAQCIPPVCPAGSVDCGAGCIDVSSDPNNCGACGNVCPSGFACSGGTCACPGGGTTSITGSVYAPNGVDPLPGVTVYIPTASVAPFAQGVSCENSCAAQLSGSPMVKTTTAANGTFTLANVPSGWNIPIVIQKNRWRRQLVIPTVTACTSNPQPNSGTGQLRLPRTSSEGDIPRIAFVTGSVDALECVLRKVGIADTEFGNPSGTGRVELYLGSGDAGARYSASTPSETTLWSSQAAINKYDMVFFACQGADYERTAAQQQVIVNYANAGGRIFAAHYSYVWLYNVAPFSATATWAVDGDSNFGADPGTGLINTASARTSLLAQWLQVVGASTTLGQIPVSTLRHDFTGVPGSSLLWLSVNDPTLGNVPLHFTFDTPVGAPAGSQCGRVVYSDFHAEPAAGTTGMTFPTECTAGTMTPEEKMLEYMIFDLGDCIGP